MKNKSAHSSKRVFSLLLSFILFFCLIGCSPNANQNTDVNNDNPDASVLYESVSDADVSDKITDNGQPIYDFDEYVNGDWYESVSDTDESRTYFWDMYSEMEEKMRDILDNTDISSMDTESGLYKTIVTYRGLMDTSDVQSRMDSIKAYIEPIQSVKNLNDLYELYANENYARINYLFNFNIKADNYGYLVPYLVPVSRRENINFYLDSLNNGDPDNGFKKCLYELGYDDSEITGIFDNALIVCDKIESYLEVYDQAQTLYFYPHEEFPGSELNVPIVDILDSLGGLGDRGQILAEVSFSDFYNDLYVQNNIELLKDYLLVGAFWLMPLSGYDNFPEEFSSLSYDDYVLGMIMYYAPDILADEYMKRYCDADDLSEVNSIILSIKTASIKLMNGVTWLGDGAKEAIKQKISRMSQYIGQNGHRDLLSDYVPGSDVIENVIALSSNMKHFERIQTYYYGSSRAPFGSIILSESPYYTKEINFLCVTPTMMSDPMFTEADTYEEKLGFFGFFIAHEIAHSSDSDGVEWDSDGTYNPVFGDESYDDYNDMLHCVIGYFDGVDTYFDLEYSGVTVYDEAYADLCAMRVCLNILAEKEDADYDLFFRTYATGMRGYYVESDTDRMLRDPHLSAKERINYILGQFDEFYETYEIDESSPYYVPENERLNIF